MQILKKGSKGDDVIALQHLLNVEGYKVTIDGDFGAKTEVAVKMLQKAHGLVDDGIVGAKTWAALGARETLSITKAPLTHCLTRSPKRKIKYLVIHYTAGTTSVAGSAKAMRGYWETKRQASADYGVDDGGAVQFSHDPANYYCWAVSGGNGITNANSISIEICSSLRKGTSASKPNHEGWYYTDAALSNAVKLAKMLMAKYNIPIERVVRHYDVTGKLCPGIVGWNDGAIYTTDGVKTNKKNNSAKWLEFKKRLV